MTEIAFKAPEQAVDAWLPLQPVGWRVLVRPYEPDVQSSGGILYPDETQQSEEYLTYVGQIVAMGSECFRAVTRSGIELANINPKPKVGDWIVFGTYGGQKIHTKSGAKYLIINDDGIMGLTSDPSAFRAYV